MTTQPNEPGEAPVPAPTAAPKPTNPEPLTQPANPDGRDNSTPTPDSTEHPKQG